MTRHALFFAVLAISVGCVSKRSRQVAAGTSHRYSEDIDIVEPSRASFDAYLIADFDPSLSHETRLAFLHAFADWASPQAPERVLLDTPVEILAATRACTDDACRLQCFDIVDIPYIYVLDVAWRSDTTISVRAVLVDNTTKKTVGKGDTVKARITRPGMGLDRLDTPRVSDVLRNGPPPSRAATDDVSAGSADATTAVYDDEPTETHFGIAAFGGGRFFDPSSPAVGGRLMLGLGNVRLMFEGAHYFPYRDGPERPYITPTLSNVIGSILVGYAWPVAWGAAYAAIGPQMGRTCQTWNHSDDSSYANCEAEFGGKLMAGVEYALLPSLAVFADAGLQLHAARSPHWGELLGGLRLWVL